MSKKNILITGGFGLLGRNLFELLNSKKYNIFILDKKKLIKHSITTFRTHILNNISLPIMNSKNLSFLWFFYFFKKIK
jgi:nucleoside-diphosphate-sugar epimerase